MIHERAEELKEKYLDKNLASENPMVRQLLWDFRNFIEKENEVKFPTPLSKADIERHGLLELCMDDCIEMELGIANLLG